MESTERSSWSSEFLGLTASSILLTWALFSWIVFEGFVFLPRSPRDGRVKRLRPRILSPELFYEFPCYVRIFSIDWNAPGSQALDRFSISVYDVQLELFQISAFSRVPTGQSIALVEVYNFNTFCFAFKLGIFHTCIYFLCRFETYMIFWERKEKQCCGVTASVFILRMYPHPITGKWYILISHVTRTLFVIISIL
jgi:hypothetical protein